MTDPTNTPVAIPPAIANPTTTDKCRFEVNVVGMMCVKCTQKVDKVFQELDTPVENLKIDFITNRVLFTAPKREILEVVCERLTAAGFGVKDSKDISYTLGSDRRTIQLQILKGEKGIITRAMKNENGTSCLTEEPRFVGKNKCSLIYNPILFRGSEIMNRLKETEEYKNQTFDFKIEDFFEDNIDNINFSEWKLWHLLLIILFNAGLVACSFITDEEKQMNPHKNGIWSYYFIAVFLLTVATVCVAGLKIYKVAFKQLFASWNINMMTLVSVGSGLALILGIVYTIWGTVEMIGDRLHDADYFIMNGTEMYFAGSTILTSVVVGKFIEGKIKKRVFSRINDIKKNLKVNVETVTRIVPRNKKFDALSKEDLAPVLIEKDDYIIINQVGMIPFDGFIEKGTLKIVENIQYGWEKVETKTKGHPIMSGSQVIAVEEEAILRVQEPLEKTLAGRLFYEIKEAASGSATNTNKTGDVLAKVTKYFIGIVAILAACTLIGWIIVKATGKVEVHNVMHMDIEVTWSYPFEKAIAVLVASCPCALGIAIPMLYAISLRKAFKSGVLVKDTASLDALHKVDTIVFDKTGTITGTFNIKDAQNVTGKYDDSALWEIISLLEKDHLQHPIGLALFQEALQRISNLEKSKFTVTRGVEDPSMHQYFASEGVIDKGIKINNETKTACLGNLKLLKRVGIQNVPELKKDSIIEMGAVEEGKAKETTVDNSQMVTLNLGIDNEIHFIVTLSLQEDLKNNVVELISNLHKNKKTIMIMSGDNRANANKIGEMLNIPLTNIHAELAPEDKETLIKNLREKEGKQVMMVGDGINDIKAFKAANVSCSINFKSSQNLTFSDFIIINNDVENISGLFKLASALTKFKIVILFVALCYNVPTIIAATGALVTVAGVDLPAFMAAWAMVLFSLLLTGVSLLMELVKIKRDRRSKKSKKNVEKAPVEEEKKVISAEDIKMVKEISKATTVETRLTVTNANSGSPNNGSPKQNVSFGSNFSGMEDKKMDEDVVISVPYVGSVVSEGVLQREE